MIKSFIRLIAYTLIVPFLIIQTTQVISSQPNIIMTGAGATFPYPIYAKWAKTYKEKTGIDLNYQPTGSVDGLKKLKESTVDFGASDYPLTKEELDKNSLAQFPAIIGGVVIVTNVEGVDKTINLTGELISKIYQGKITKWNDDAIKVINQGVTFPDKTITVVTRSDGSGTTFIFTTYLSQIDSNYWNSDTIKPSTQIHWPIGLEEKGNDGIANAVKTHLNSIGYVEFSYAQEHKLQTTNLTNKDGYFVEPSLKSFQAAAENTKWDDANGFNEILTNRPGKNSWPITAASFILINKDKAKNINNGRIATFFRWAFRNGKDMATELNFIVLPESVLNIIDNRVLFENRYFTH